MLVNSSITIIKQKPRRQYMYSEVRNLWIAFYDKPSITPFTTWIFSACGFFGRPGIRIIVPAIATIIPAPALITKLRIVIGNPEGAP